MKKVQSQITRIAKIRPTLELGLFDTSSICCSHTCFGCELSHFVEHNHATDSNLDRIVSKHEKATAGCMVHRATDSTLDCFVHKHKKVPTVDTHHHHPTVDMDST